MKRLNHLYDFNSNFVCTNLNLVLGLKKTFVKKNTEIHKNDMNKDRVRFSH